MSSANIKKLKKERSKLLAEMAKMTQLLHGSWVERYSVCSRPECKCHKGERHGPRRYVVINEEGHQRPKYVPNAQVDAVRHGIDQYHRLQQIVFRITCINIKLIREKAYAKD